MVLTFISALGEAKADSLTLRPGPNQLGLYDETLSQIQNPKQQKASANHLYYQHRCVKTYLIPKFWTITHLPLGFEPRGIP